MNYSSGAQNEAVWGVRIMTEMFLRVCIKKGTFIYPSSGFPCHSGHSLMRTESREAILMSHGTLIEEYIVLTTAMTLDSEMVSDSLNLRLRN
jgi:hypothetical protein